jgi:hypothetical protein
MRGPDRRLLVKAALLLWAVRLGLWVLPYRLVRRLVARPLSRRSSRASVSVPALDEVERIAKAVRAARRYVPAATCLTQALATEWLLRRVGQPASLRIGVRRTDEGVFQAHAWVESGGRVVIGRHTGISRYKVLPNIGEGEK